MGLILSVYRAANGADCTAGGLSSEHDTITVVNLNGPFEPQPHRPAFLIVDGYAIGTDDKMLVPAENLGTEQWPDWQPKGRPSFGGNFASTSDGRFREKFAHYAAIPIHDRYE